MESLAACNKRRPTVLVCAEISGELSTALSRVCAVDFWPAGEPDIPLDLADRADVVIFRSPFRLSQSTAKNMRNLKMVIRAGSGMEGLCAEELAARGIRVHRINLAGASVAEHAIALLLSAARSIPIMNAATKSGRWLKSQAKGIELYGKAILVVGFGNVGRRVARIAAGFGMHILIVDPSLWKPEKKDALEEIRSASCVTLDDGLIAADFIVLCCPLTPQTRHLIDEQAAFRIRRGAILINVARADVVTEQAMAAALRSNRLAAICLDVPYGEPNPDSELLKDERIVVTPHIGSQTFEARRRIEDEILRLVTSYAIEQLQNE